jgi:hypothetical protein
MNLRSLLTITVLFTLFFSVQAFARKPAVEDFVGVETEEYQPTSKGTEVLFDFGNHIESVKPEQITNKVTKTQSHFFVGLTIVAFILLPFFMWYAVTNTARKNDEESMDLDPTQTTSNVANLSDYKNDTKTDKDDIKKAS